MLRPDIVLVHAGDHTGAAAGAQPGIPPGGPYGGGDCTGRFSLADRLLTGSGAGFADLHRYSAKRRKARAGVQLLLTDSPVKICLRNVVIEI